MNGRHEDDDGNDLDGTHFYVIVSKFCNQTDTMIDEEMQI